MRAVPADLTASRRPGATVLAALVAVSTVVAGALLAAAPAAAAGPKYPRVMPVTSSATFLVYRQKTANAYGLSLTKGSTLYYVGTRGSRHTLKEFDPQGFPSLQASTLVQSAAPNSRFDPVYDPVAPEHVRWRDLKTGARGVTEIPATDDYVGAAPGGWIATRAVAATSPGGAPTKHVIRYTTAGTSVDLGTPFATSTLFSVVPGPKGVVVHSRNDFDDPGTGSIRYADYSAPGHWRTVLAAGAGVDTFCTPPSATHVVCEVRRPAKHSGEVLLALHSSSRVWLSDHPTACQVLSLRAIGSRAIGEETADQGHCVDGRLLQVDAHGTVTRSKRLWGTHASAITEGLGGILIDTGDQRRIVRLSGVRSAPHVVATAR